MYQVCSSALWFRGLRLHANRYWQPVYEKLTKLIRLIKYILIFISVITKAQTGEYIGKSESGFSYERNKRTRKVKKFNEKIVEKRLLINKDSTFKFEYETNLLFTRSPIYRCEGIWKMTNDTIVLNSKFRSTDFVKVNESEQPTIPNDLLILTFKSEKGFYSGKLYVNEKLITTINYDDTVYYKCDKVESLKIEFSYPGSFTFIHMPNDKKTNVFSFKINAEIDENNLCLKNYKLILKNDELEPLEKVGPLSVDINYIIKKP